jgi:hypothetical protein
LTRFRLYGTAGCHLCEKAEALLKELERREGLAVPVQPVDIAGQPDLEDRYGIRIPVLYDSRTGAELGWPFDAAALRRFVEAALAPTP